MLAEQQQAALDKAYQEHPERFVQGPPKVKMPPENVYINPLMENGEHPSESGVNFPTLPRANIH